MVYFQKRLSSKNPNEMSCDLLLGGLGVDGREYGRDVFPQVPFNALNLGMIYEALCDVINFPPHNNPCVVHLVVHGHFLRSVKLGVNRGHFLVDDDVDVVSLSFSFSFLFTF